VIPPVASAAPPRTVATGSAAGTVTATSESSFTIQTAGPRVGVVNALAASANYVTKRDYPYVWGGGHAQAGIASSGLTSRRRKRRQMGFDCSGSVAAVLAGAGLWPAGTGVPNDAGIIVTLRRQRLIVPGVGTGPVEVTLYDRPGVHIFMNIDGRFFGTSDGGAGGNPNGGAGWLDDGAPDASRRAYKPYHFVPSVLRSSTTAGHIVSFQLGALDPPAAVEVGDTVGVAYQENSAGSLFATSITYPGSTVGTGTVTDIAPDGSSFSLQTSSGQTLTLGVPDPALVRDLADGDVVQVTYTTSGTTLTARVVTVTSTATAGGDDTNGDHSGP
jgi:hypothetical protein